SCSFGDMAAGASNTIVLSTATSFTACTSMPNLASVSSGNNPTLNDPGSITCLPPNLTVVKTPDGQTINAGDTATFTIVVTNTGTGVAKSVTLTDTLPVGGGVSWALTPAVTGCAINGTTPLVLSCSFGDMVASASKTIVLSAATSFT